MRKIMLRVVLAVTAALVAVGFTTSAAQAGPPAPAMLAQPIEICKVITIFDIVIFEWDCYTA